MKPRFLLVLFPAAALFDWWWSHSLSMWGVAPSWLLVATVAVAAIDGPAPAQVLGFGWGLIRDAVSVHLFGAHALAFGLVAFIVGRGRRLLDLSSPPSQGPFVLILSAVYALFYGALGWLFAGTFLWPGFRGLVAVPLANGIAALFVFPYLKRKAR